MSEKYPQELSFPLGLSVGGRLKEEHLRFAPLLSELGIRRIEAMPGGLLEFETLPVSPALACLEANGIIVNSIHSAFGTQFDISSPDPAIRQSGVRAVIEAVRLAERLGAGLVVFHASAEPIEDAERAERLRRAKESIEGLVPYAVRAGVKLALEYLPRSELGNSPEELFQLTEDSEPLGVCFDTNHIPPGASIPRLLEELSPKLIALHAADFDGVTEKHWLPFEGVINWRNVVRTLQRIAYRGTFMIEAGLGDNPTENLRKLRERLGEIGFKA